MGKNLKYIICKVCGDNYPIDLFTRCPKCGNEKLDKRQN